MQNEDSTNFFFYHDILPGEAGQTVDRYVDVLAGAGVRTLFCNTNARRTNYHSDVWGAFWDGYDPAGPDDQPFLAPIPQADRKNWRHPSAACSRSTARESTTRPGSLSAAGTTASRLGSPCG